jgi:DNA processing protein
MSKSSAIFQSTHLPALLSEIPDPPKTIFYKGNLPPPELTLLTVVGSRKYTSYGRQVVEHLISGLKGYPIGIVSGLALGIDTLAHQTALKNKLYTLAVPGSGLADSVLYPASNKKLARDILEQGGGLLSEFEENQVAMPWTFPRRNRIMAGMAPATLLIEASEKSGTLITARLAADYNREVMVVPGSIFSSNSYGVHQFLKLGATPVTTPLDILEVLKVQAQESASAKTDPITDPVWTTILNNLNEPRTKDELVRLTNETTEKVGIALSGLEIEGYIVFNSPYYRRT